MEVLRVVKLSNNATIPTRGSTNAVGYDLYSASEYTVPPGGNALVFTDLQIYLPQGCYGRIASRSGIVWEYSVVVQAGVIDPDYSGNLGVLLFNHGMRAFDIFKGSRVAQSICERACFPSIEVISEGALVPSQRVDGFGSTGGYVAWSRDLSTPSSPDSSNQ